MSAASTGDSKHAITDSAAAFLASLIFAS